MKMKRKKLRRLTHNEGRQIRKMYESGEANQVELMKLFSVCQTTICNALNKGRYGIKDADNKRNRPINDRKLEGFNSCMRCQRPVAKPLHFCPPCKAANDHVSHRLFKARGT